MMEDVDTPDVEPDANGNSSNDFFSYYYTDNDPSSPQKGNMGRDKTNSTEPPSLSELNAEKIESYYPVLIFLALIFVLGILSNFVVCYIYRCRSRRATSNFFVIFFAISDLIFCILGIAAELLHLIMPYEFKVKTLCQSTAFFRSFLVCQLPLTLICVAYDCYRKVCRPNDDFSVKKARFLCGMSIIVSILLSIPAFSTYEVVTVIFPENRAVTGTACAPDPNRAEWLNILHYACMLFPFTVSLAVMTSFYSLIAVSLCKQKQAEERGEKPSPLKREFPKKHTFVSKEDISSTSTSYYDEIRRLPSQTSSLHSSKPVYNDPARVPLKASTTGATVKKTNSMQAATNSGNVPIIPLHVKNTRLASIFALISIVFVIFMLPFVVIAVLSVATDVFEHPLLEYDVDLSYNFLVRSYLLNCLTKPVVYLIFNVNFRKAVKHLFSKMWGLCLRPSPSESPTSDTQAQRGTTLPPSSSSSSSSSSRNLLKRHDQRAKVEMSPMLQRSADSQGSSSSSTHKPRERWRWDQAN